MRPKMRNAKSKVAKLRGNRKDPDVVKSSVSITEPNCIKPKTGIETSGYPKLFEDETKSKRDTSRINMVEPKRMAEKIGDARPKHVISRIERKKSECKRSRIEGFNPTREELKDSIAESSCPGDLSSKEEPKEVQSETNDVNPKLALLDDEEVDSILSILLTDMKKSSMK